MNENKSNTINISIPAKVFGVIAFLVALAFFIYYSKEVLITIAMSIVISLSIEPLIRFFEHLKLAHKHIFNRGVSVLMSYLIVILSLVGILYYSIPELGRQIPLIIETFNQTINRYSEQYNLTIQLPNLSQYVDRVVSFSVGFFSNIISVLSLILLSLYISLELKEIKVFFHKLLPNGRKTIFDKIIDDLETGMGQWAKGQLILMLVIGVLSTAVLYFLGNPYYLPLGIIAGILEVVPIVGPLITAILASIISYSVGGPSAGIATAVSFYLIQLLENNLLVPKVMQKVSGFSPVLILLSLLIFSNLFGIIGAILAIPILILGNTLLKVFVFKSESSERAE